MEEADKAIAGNIKKKPKAAAPAQPGDASAWRGLID